MRLTFLLSKGKAVPISLFRGTKGSANHVFQRGNDFYQESDVRQNSSICRKSRHFERPGDGIFINLYTIENRLLLLLFRSHEKDGYNTERKTKHIYANLKKKIE